MISLHLSFEIGATWMRPTNRFANVLFRSTVVNARISYHVIVGVFFHYWACAVEHITSLCSIGQSAIFHKEVVCLTDRQCTIYFIAIILLFITRSSKAEQ